MKFGPGNLDCEAQIRFVISSKQLGAHVSSRTLINTCLVPDQSLETKTWDYSGKSNVGDTENRVFSSPHKHRFSALHVMRETHNKEETQDQNRSRLDLISCQGLI